MNSNKQIEFCIECREFVEYDLSRKILEGEIFGKKYVYYGDVATCPVCGQEIFVPEIAESNFEALLAKHKEESQPNE